jgi:DNA-binding GntR family transcriptional regulator
MEAGATERALDHMRVMVLEGTLLPGEQLRQQEMAELIGVSRVPLREALNVLADQGLLTHRPNSGYFVAKRNAAETRQIRRMLELLENELLSSIAWPSEEVLGRLRALNGQMKAAVDAHQWLKLMHLNREFHFQIFGLSSDHIILNELRRLWGLGEPLFALKLAHPRAAQQTVLEHDAIIKTLEEQDRGSCIRAMEAHRHSTHSDPQG